MYKFLFYSWFGKNKKYKSQIKVLFNKTIRKIKYLLFKRTKPTFLIVDNRF